MKEKEILVVSFIIGLGIFALSFFFLENETNLPTPRGGHT